MAQVTAQMVKELRERTQAGMSDCKASLVEAEGDMEKAIEIIQKKGLAKGAKRASAAATEGEVRAQVFDGSRGVIVEVNSQTDFVARNDGFQAFVGALINVAAETPAGSNIGEQKLPSGKTVEETRADLSGTIGENIQVRRWERFDLQGPGLVHSYVHMGGKIAVLIEIGTPASAAGHDAVKKFADDTAMQIAAMAAQFVDRSQVPAADLAKQGEIFEAQMKKEKEEGTLKAPEASWPKIIEGKKAKWCTEICLLEQESVLVPGSSVDKLRAQLSKEAGGEVTIRRFVRFERGEGLAKKSDDFAAEVAKMAGGLETVARRRGGLCALSVDLDEIGHYHAIHGLPSPSGGAAFAVYRVALDRFSAIARRHDVPLTLFAVGADLATAGNAQKLGELASQGHEIGNHSLDHRYDLVHLPDAEQRRQVGVGREVLEGATGQRVLGFRAPGYTVSDALLRVVASTGHRYDSSVFPCAPYLAAKLSVMAAMRLRGRRSASIAGDPRAALAPTSPYRLGPRYWRRGDGLAELPIQVTPGPRLPVIGTSLLLPPWPLALALLRSCVGQPTLNLELHGIDVLGAADGLDALRGHQPDAAVPAALKLERLASMIELLREAGYRFVRLEELAR